MSNYKPFRLLLEKIIYFNLQNLCERDCKTHFSYGPENYPFFSKVLVLLFGCRWTEAQISVGEMRHKRMNLQEQWGMSRWHSVSENCSLSVTARFQIQDKRLRCLYNIAKWTWRPGFSWIPQFLPACYRALLVGTPHPLPLILPPTQRLGCPSSSCPSLYNPAILVTPSFLGSPG